MSRVLFAWELGANFGHVTTLIPIARHLQSRGHEVLFALHELASGAEALAASGLAYIAAPALRFVRDPRIPVVSYADLLAAHGFANPAVLPWAARAWLATFELFRPDLVVLDHAPCALFACRIRGVSHLVLGNGFAIPPALAPMPSIMPWEKIPPERLAQADAAVTRVMDAVARSLGGRGVGAVHELFDAERCVLSTFPELDHYPERRGAKYHGASFVTDSGEEAAYRGSGKPRVFVYLRDHRVLGPVIEALAEREADAVLIAPGLPAALKTRAARAPSLQVRETPVRLDRMLAGADAVVCTAGHGMVAASLCAGKPLVLLPSNTEQALTTQRVVALGAGASFMPAETRDKFGPALDRVLTEKRYRVQAARFAEKYRRYDPRRAAGALARRVEELLEKR